MKQPANKTASSHFRKRLIVGACAVVGIGLITAPAFAASLHTPTGPSMKLTQADFDTVVVSGDNFPDASSVILTASGAGLTGSGTVTSDAGGRFLVAFRLPASSTGVLNIVSTPIPVSGHISIKVPAPVTTTTMAPTTTTTTAPGATTTTTTALPATTTTTTPKPAPTTTTTTAPPPPNPVLDNKVLMIPGASALNGAVAKYNALGTTINAQTVQINARDKNASAVQVDAVKNYASLLTALNGEVTTTNGQVLTLNTQALAASNQAQLDALAPMVTTITSRENDQIAKANAIVAAGAALLKTLPAA